MTTAATRFMRRATPLLLALVPGAISPALAWATYRMPEVAEVPVERLVANLEKTLDTVGSSSSTAPTPKEEAATRLNLARLHAMAFAKKAETAQVLAGREDQAWFGFEPAFVPFQTKPVTDPKQEAAAKGHLDEAIRQYARVLGLDEENLTAALGHAWCVDQSGKKDEAIRLYRKVIDTAWKADGALKQGNLTAAT
jgi:tetratricopeptide (TPR) repeat protein